jgi:NAD(P)-dependent dehydrogenase (short-subunit alcohol dehydrogenase family)
MASSVTGKIAFITGGASGIGAALATKLVDQGAEVWIGDRQVGSAEELAQQLNGIGGKARAIEVDVRSFPGAAFASVVDAVEQSGRIDYLV